MQTGGTSVVASPFCRLASRSSAAGEKIDCRGRQLVFQKRGRTALFLVCSSMHSRCLSGYPYVHGTAKGYSNVALPGFFKGTEMPTAGWWEALWPDPATVLNQVGIRAGMTVIDLCSGDGWFTLQIARIARRVIAIDIDRKLLDLAKSRLAESGFTNCDFVEGDAYGIAELVPQPVDFVFLANAFHGVPERTRLARAVAHALKSGGRFAIVNWHARPREQTTILGEPRGPFDRTQDDPRNNGSRCRAGGVAVGSDRRTAAVSLRRDFRKTLSGRCEVRLGASGCISWATAC